MVLTLMIPMRTIFNLEEIITVRHLELMCKVIMATGTIVGYAYGWSSLSPGMVAIHMNCMPLKTGRLVLTGGATGS